MLNNPAVTKCRRGYNSDTHIFQQLGKDGGLFQQNDNHIVDDRIAHILNEASNLMKNPSQQQQQHQHQQMLQHQESLRAMLNDEDDSSNDNDSKSPNNNHCSSPFSKDNSNSRRNKKYENDDIPQEKVTRIYQEELSKLISSRDAFPK